MGVRGTIINIELLISKLGLLILQLSDPMQTFHIPKLIHLYKK